MHKTLFKLFLLITVLSGCATQPQSQWPAGAPDRSWFVEQYLADEDNREIQSREKYLNWIKQFYEGNFLQPVGWLETTTLVTANIDDPAQKAMIEEKLFQYGKIIAAEWAKDTPDRPITLREVQIWGNALRKSVHLDQQVNYVDRVSNDIDRLMNGEMHRDVISRARYFKTDEEDPFL